MCSEQKQETKNRLGPQIYSTQRTKQPVGQLNKKILSEDQSREQKGFQFQGLSQGSAALDSDFKSTELRSRPAAASGLEPSKENPLLPAFNLKPQLSSDTDPFESPNYSPSWIDKEDFDHLPSICFSKLSVLPTACNWDLTFQKSQQLALSLPSRSADDIQAESFLAIDESKDQMLDMPSNSHVSIFTSMTQTLLDSGA